VGLQYIRALAAVMVLIGHTIAEAEHYLSVDLPFDTVPWTRGVDMFFVLSGFIIMLSGHRLFGQPEATLSFLRRRLRRVVPLYWFFTTLMLGVLLLSPGATKDTVLDWQQIAASYLFLPYERYDGRVAPILSLGWTLNYEIFFYVVFAISLTVRTLWAPSIVLLLWVIAGAFAGFEETVLRAWSNPIVLEFCFGLWVGHWFVRRKSPLNASRAIALLCAVVALVLLYVLHQINGLPRFLAAGLPSALLVFGMAVFWPSNAPETFGGRICETLGDSSYALYLSHRFALRSVTLAVIPALPAGQTGAWVYVGLATVSALILGSIVHFCLERPMFLSRRRPVRWA